MVPEGFTVFFAASAGASATLLGLLFVAVAVDPERVFGGGARADRRAVALAAYVALIDAFFVSLFALIPDTNVGGVALAMAGLGLTNTVPSQVRRLWRERRLLRGTALAITGLVVYGLQLWYAWALVRNPTESYFVYALAYLMIGVYAVGLGRAWEILGAPQEGIIGRLLGRDDEHDQITKREAPSPEEPEHRRGTEDRDLS